jgi:YVTN family beta-propeller protein
MAVDSPKVGVGTGAVSSGSFPSKGKVYAINTTTNTVVDSVTVGDGPSDIAIKNQSLFVLHGGHVMKLNAAPLSVSDSSFIRISNALYFYAMQTDDISGDIYVSRITTNGGAGEVAIYTSAGALRRAPFRVGIFPGAFAFK